MTRKIYVPKPIDELTFSHDFIFGKVMSEPKICKLLLENLLGIKVGKITYPTLQKVLRPKYKSKGVRIDVFAEDAKALYDIEIQISRKKDLAKRMRYYQSLIDADFLLRGRDYSELKTSYIIFICLYDPFGKGLPVYEFERTCKNNKNINFGDKSYFVCYNMKGFDKKSRKAINEFSKYVLKGDVTGDFSKTLDDAVRQVKLDEKYRREYMFGRLNYYDDMEAATKRGIRRGMKKGMEKGLAKGRVEAISETAKNLLSCGVPVEIIAKSTGLTLEQIAQL